MKFDLHNFIFDLVGVDSKNEEEKSLIKSLIWENHLPNLVKTCIIVLDKETLLKKQKQKNNFLGAQKTSRWINQKATNSILTPPPPTLLYVLFVRKYRKKCVNILNKLALPLFVLEEVEFN